MIKAQNKRLLHNGSFIRIIRFKLVAVLSFTLLLIIMGMIGCLQTACLAVSARVATPTSVVQPVRIPLATPTLLADQNKGINVYFSKVTAGGGPWGATFAMKRSGEVLNHTGSADVIASYAIEQLIAGPTPAELQAGYQSLVKQSLYGKSTCADQANFVLTLDKKGTLPKLGTATIELCRQVASAGVGMDAAIRAEIGSTLKQFPSIKNVIILLNDGHCFGDESGTDLCLH
jgi:hypothetical protein